MALKKKKKSSNLFSGLSRQSGLLAIVVLLITIIMLFLFADRGTLHFYKSYREKEQLIEEIDTLEKKKERLLIEKDKLENDPQYIEKIAREKYKMKKKGEKVLQVETDKD